MILGSPPGDLHFWVLLSASNTNKNTSNNTNKKTRKNWRQFPLSLRQGKKGKRNDPWQSPPAVCIFGSFQVLLIRIMIRLRIFSLFFFCVAAELASRTTQIGKYITCYDRGCKCTDLDLSCMGLLDAVEDADIYCRLDIGNLNRPIGLFRELASELRKRINSSSVCSDDKGQFPWIRCKPGRTILHLF